MSDEHDDEREDGLPDGAADATAPGTPKARRATGDADTEPAGQGEAGTDSPADAAPADEDDDSGAAPRLRPRVPVDAIEAEPVDPMEVAAEAQKKGRLKWIVLGVVGVLLAGGGVFAYLVNDTKAEEEERFTAADAVDTQEAWTEYLAWARGVRQAGGLGAWLALGYTEIDAHQSVAKRRLLLQRTRSAVAHRNYDYLCHLRSIGATQNDPEVAAAVQQGLDERKERAVIELRNVAGRRSTPPNIIAAFEAGLRAADGCEGAALRTTITHVIDPSPAFDAELPSGGSVRAALEAIDVDAMANAVLGDLSEGIAEATNGLLHPAGDGEEPRIEAEFQVTMLAHDRFAIPSGGSLPAVSLKIKSNVRGGDAPYEHEETFHAPPTVALEFFRAEDGDIAGVFAHTVEALYPSVRAKVRQALALERFRIGSSYVAFGCRNPELLVFDRVLQGETERGVESFDGSCLDLDDEDYYEGNLSDDELMDMARPERVHRLVVTERARVVMEVDSEFTPLLYVRSECSQVSSEVACVADDYLLAETLDPGVYSVFVDTTVQGDFGEYSLYATVRTEEDTAGACADATPLPESLRVEGRTRGGQDRVEGSCGGVGSPEQVYSLEVSEPSRVRCTVTAPDQHTSNRVVLYWRTDCADASTETECKIATRSSAPVIERIAQPGTHAIVVDGHRFNQDASFTLQCEVASLANPGGAPADSCEAPGELRAEAMEVPLDTLRATDDVQLACNAGEAPDLVHRLELARVSQVRVGTTGTVAGAVGLGTTCGGAEVACRGVVERILAPGTYYVTSESRPRPFGSGSLQLQVRDLQAECDDAPLVRSGTTQVPMPSAAVPLSISCAASSNRYQLRKVVLQERARVVARTHTRSRLALWRGCASEEILCRDNGSVDRAIDQVLDAGTYFLVMTHSSSSPIDLELEITRQ